MSVIVTEKAAKEVKKVMEEQGMSLDEFALRVGVSGGGCSGFSYALTFDKKENFNEATDNKLTFEGIDVLLDMKSELYLSGTVIDFYEGIEKRGFTFNNPNSKNSCGCGSSFSV
jgi:iron-sulfur cluster assembly protein